jgi:hypothetical protein
MGVLATCLGSLATSTEVLATCLGASQITLKQTGKKNIFFGNAVGAAGNGGYYLSFNDL